jgi:hypothetical protein
VNPVAVTVLPLPAAPDPNVAVPPANVTTSLPTLPASDRVAIVAESFPS